MRRVLRWSLPLLLTFPTPAATAAQPRLDAHVHVLSPAGASWLRAHAPDDLLTGARTGADVMAMLDRSGTGRAVIISEAYALSAGAHEPGEQARVRQENDWVAAEAQRAGGRLVAFCSVNALREYAVRETARCAALAGVRGIKLSLAAAGADLRDSVHVRRLRALFARADSSGLAVLAHIRTMRADYGAADAAIFLEQVMPAAPRVTVQVAHLAGWGGYDDATDEALGVFAQAVREKRAPPNLYFDMAWVLHVGAADERAGQRARRVVERIGELGAERVLFASDWPLADCAEYHTLLHAAFAAQPALLDSVYRTRPPYLGR